MQAGLAEGLIQQDLWGHELHGLLGSLRLVLELPAEIGLLRGWYLPALCILIENNKISKSFVLDYRISFHHS